MSAVTETQPARKWAMPDTLVIIFFVAILTSLATWVVPVGMFDSQEVQYQVDGQTKTRKVVDPTLSVFWPTRPVKRSIIRLNSSLPAMKARD